MVDGAGGCGARRAWRGRAGGCATSERACAGAMRRRPLARRVEAGFLARSRSASPAPSRATTAGEVREVERLFLDSIDAAERTHLHREPVPDLHRRSRERLAQRMRERPELEVLIVAPQQPRLLARSPHHAQRAHPLHARLAGSRRRRPRAPGLSAVADGESTTDTMVHSKVMVVDDRFLRDRLRQSQQPLDGHRYRVRPGRSRRTTSRAARPSLAVRNRLLADHCGVTAEEVAAALRAERIADRGGRQAVTATAIACVRSTTASPIRSEIATYIESMADPEQPIAARRRSGSCDGRRRTGVAAASDDAASRRRSCLIALDAGLAIHAGCELRRARTYRARHAATAFAQNPWAPLMVVGDLCRGGLVAFPVNILIAATAATFGPWPGFAYARGRRAGERGRDLRRRRAARQAKRCAT